MRLSSVARLFRRLVIPRAKTRCVVAAFLKPAAPDPGRPLAAALLAATSL